MTHKLTFILNNYMNIDKLTKKFPLTASERQANRQMKLKKALLDYETLKFDVSISNAMIKNVLLSLDQVPDHSECKTLIDIVKNQIQSSLLVFDHLHNK